MTRAVAYPNSPPPPLPPPPPPPYTLSGPCITTKNRTILNMSDINHMRRKLFNIVRGHTQRGQHQYFGGGGVYCKMYIHACMHTHTHMYERMYKLLNGQTPMHACTHTCMHACICTHTIIHLNLDLKSIKSKQMISMEKNNKYIHVILLQVSEVTRKVFVYYIT